MSSVISENVQLTVMENSLKNSISISINDYYATGGCISVFVQLSHKQASELCNLILEKLPKNV